MRKVGLTSGGHVLVEMSTLEWADLQGRRLEGTGSEQEARRFIEGIEDDRLRHTLLRAAWKGTLAQGLSMEALAEVASGRLSVWGVGEARREMLRRYLKETKGEKDG